MEWYQTGNLDVSCSLGNIETGVEGPRLGLCAPIKVRACVQVCNFFLSSLPGLYFCLCESMHRRDACGKE